MAAQRVPLASPALRSAAKPARAFPFLEQLSFSSVLAKMHLFALFAVVTVRTVGGLLLQNCKVSVRLRAHSQQEKCVEQRNGAKSLRQSVAHPLDCEGGMCSTKVRGWGFIIAQQQSPQTFSFVLLVRRLQTRHLQGTRGKERLLLQTLRDLYWCVGSFVSTAQCLFIDPSHLWVVKGGGLHFVQPRHRGTDCCPLRSPL